MKTELQGLLVKNKITAVFLLIGASIGIGLATSNLWVGVGVGFGLFTFVGFISAKTELER